MINCNRYARIGLGNKIVRTSVTLEKITNAALKCNHSDKIIPKKGEK